MMKNTSSIKHWQRCNISEGLMNRLDENMLSVSDIFYLNIKLRPEGTTPGTPLQPHFSICLCLHASLVCLLRRWQFDGEQKCYRIRS